MKWPVLIAFAAALAVAIFVVISRSRAPAAPAPAGKDRERRTEIQDRSGWRTFHGTFTLDGVAGSTVPDAPELLWKFKAGNRVDVTPVSADGRVYFTTAKGGLFALDLNGREIWKITISPDSFSSPPTLIDDLLVVASGKGLLHAFATETGKEKWVYDIAGTVQGSPNRIDLPGGRKGIMAISQSEGSIHGIELDTGKGVWKTPGVERCDGSASVGGGQIVMGSCASALHVYSVNKAEKTMDIPLGNDNQVAGGVAMSGATAFAGTRSGKLCAVDVAAGKILWTNGDGQGEAFMTPAVNETMVVFGADDGKVYGLKRDTGSKLWAFDTGNRPMSPVVVSIGPRRRQEALVGAGQRRHQLSRRRRGTDPRGRRRRHRQRLRAQVTHVRKRDPPGTPRRRQVVCFSGGRRDVRLARRRLEHRQGRIGRDRRTFGVRQEHAAEHHRHARSADIGSDPARRPRRFRAQRGATRRSPIASAGFRLPASSLAAAMLARSDRSGGRSDRPAIFAYDLAGADTGERELVPLFDRVADRQRPARNLDPLTRFERP